jgi:hypothetical protein
MPRENMTPRAARLAEIRRRIANGAYETSARIEAAVEAFLDSADALAVLEVPTTKNPQGSHD